MNIAMRHIAGIALLCSCGLFSCVRKEETDEKDLKIIPIEEAYRHPSSLKASDYFRQIRYVPLETTDSSLVGDNPTVWIAGDRLIVSSRPNRCMAFDKSTGRFLCSIGHIGNDPRGALSLSGWLNAAAGHIYFPAGNGRSVIYDTAGRFVGDHQDREMTDGLYGIDTYDYLNDSLLVTHLPATLNKPDRILVYQGDSLLSVFPSRGETVSPLSGAMADIQRMNARKNEETGYDAIYMTYKDGRQNCLVPSEQIFWHKGEELLFRETFNDTIYRVTTSGLVPVKRLDFGAMRWDRKDRYQPEKDRAIYPLDVYESDRLLWLRFVVNLHHPEEWDVYNAIYDKESAEAKVASFKEGVYDDLHHFLPLQPSFASPSGEFAQLIPASTIVEWFERNGRNEEWPEEIKALEKLTEEDNPVILLAR